jgi:hypothetical protein
MGDPHSFPQLLAQAKIAFSKVTFGNVHGAPVGEARFRVGVDADVFFLAFRLLLFLTAFLAVVAAFVALATGLDFG